MKHIIFLLIASLIAVWLLFSLLLYIFQSRLIYFPDNTLWTTPSSFDLPWETVTLTAADGIKLHGWWIPHENPRATLLFLHGNGGNISHRIQKLQLYHRLNLSVLIIDYRGYGQSEGHPTEQGTYLDAEAGWIHLTQTYHIPPQNIVIYGESLGGAMAAWLANRVTAGAVILESSFTSIANMGRHFYPFLPIDLITRIQYPTAEYIRTATQPLLVIHSPADEIIPFAMGRELFEVASFPKEFLEIRGDHNGGFLYSGDLYTEGLGRFIRKYFDQSRPQS